MDIDDDIELIATNDGLVWLYLEDTQEFVLTEFRLIEEEQNAFYRKRNKHSQSNIIQDGKQMESSRC